MKPFVFKLQTALGLKQKQEEQQKQIMGKLQIKYQQELTLLDSFQTKLLNLQAHLRVEQMAIIELPKIISYQEYMPVLHSRIKQQSEQVDRLLAEIEQARAVLVSLMQERKILEKLKAKKYEEWRKQDLLEEQKNIDEMAMNTYLNNHMLYV